MKDPTVNTQMSESALLYYGFILLDMKSSKKALEDFWVHTLFFGFVSELIFCFPLSSPKVNVFPSEKNAKGNIEPMQAGVDLLG